ncbi:MAG: hypothetical protein JWN73_4881 [Betaproteobacteria bacterium]|nr:hypothetical protein [Betaproteobacteria bacterium]
MMTDCMLIGALFLAAVWVLDPLRVGLDRLILVKHLPLLALTGTLVLVVIGRVLFPRRNTPAAPLREAAGALWPFILFGCAVLLGSLYGRFAGGVENSFLNMGLFMMVAPVLAWLILTSTQPARLARGFFIALGCVAAGDGLLQWAHFAGDTFFHGTEFAVIPMAAYCWFAFKPGFLRLAGTAFFLSLAPAEHKNTGFLLAIVVVAYCGYWSLRARYRAARDGMARERQIGWAVFMAGGLMLVGLSFYALRKVLLPDGNPQYRLHTYEKALDKFHASPLFGNWFTGPATERFELFQVSMSTSNVLPTHSDPLDILANGGLLYALVFLYGIWRVLRLTLGALDRAETSAAPECAPALHGCVVIFISGILVYAFNPVLTQPNAALIYWAASGIGVGLALRMRGPATAAAAVETRAGAFAPMAVPVPGARR